MTKIITINKMILIKMEAKNKFSTQILFFGKKIAKSYFPVDITLNILAIAMKKAATPKSEGENIRVIKGTDKINIICETNVPPDRVRIF